LCTCLPYFLEPAGVLEDPHGPLTGTTLFCTDVPFVLSQRVEFDPHRRFAVDVATPTDLATSDPEPKNSVSKTIEHLPGGPVLEILSFENRHGG
jgi:hypothetical protein